MQTGGANYLFYESDFYFPLICESVCVFYLASAIRFSEKAGKTIVWLGSLTFGIYLVVDYVLWDLKDIYYQMVASGAPAMMMMLFVEITALIGAAAVVWLLKKTPGMKKLL